MGTFIKLSNHRRNCMHLITQDGLPFLRSQDQSTGKLYQHKPVYIRATKQYRYAQINDKTFFQNIPNKMKLLIGAALTITAVVCLVLYNYRNAPTIVDLNRKVTCTGDMSDEYDEYTCENGEWILSSTSIPPAFDSRINDCRKGFDAPWCIDGKYYHHLGPECLKNRQRNLMGYRCAERTGL